MDEQVRDQARSSVNPGIDPVLNALPDPEIHRGDADQFTRDATYLPGHARLSPGDGRQEGKPAAKSENPGLANPMDDPAPAPRVVRAEDFARGIGEFHDGAARTSPGNAPSRAPVTPEQALFGEVRANVGVPMSVDVGRMPNNDDHAPSHVSEPHAAEPAVTKQPGISFLGRGPSGAWSKE